jgi:hypothetical protein
MVQIGSGGVFCSRIITVYTLVQCNIRHELGKKCCGVSSYGKTIIRVSCIVVVQFK